MAINDNIQILQMSRGFGKTEAARRAMFKTKERIAIVTNNGIRYSEWADAEEIE